MLLDLILIELAIKQENGWRSIGAIEEEEHMKNEHQNFRLIIGRFTPLSSQFFANFMNIFPQKLRFRLSFRGAERI
jgi:hypothetical protein